VELASSRAEAPNIVAASVNVVGVLPASVYESF